MLFDYALMIATEIFNKSLFHFFMQLLLQIHSEFLTKSVPFYVNGNF